MPGFVNEGIWWPGNRNAAIVFGTKEYNRITPWPGNKLGYYSCHFVEKDARKLQWHLVKCPILLSGCQLGVQCGILIKNLNPSAWLVGSSYAMRVGWW